MLASASPLLPTLLTSGLVLAFIAALFNAAANLQLTAIPTTPLAACLGFILGYQQWLHTEAIGRLPWLDGWLNTPSNHRVHHGSQAQYLDKNYGAVLMIWDRVFGSYQPEVEAVRYGLTEAISSSHPVRVHLHEALRLLRDLNQAGDWRTRWLLLWKPPGWSR